MCVVGSWIVVPCYAFGLGVLRWYFVFDLFLERYLPVVAHYWTEIGSV